MPWKWCMGGGERLTLVVVNGCGVTSVTNAKQIVPEQVTTAPTAVQRWMVMGMREKLIELLRNCPYRPRPNMMWELIADHLIANGVTIPVRCKDCKYYRRKEIR